MAACLGDSYERFSVRLPLYPMLPDSSKQKYIDEYMEVGKKDEETGMLTRLITSNDEMFGLEVTMNKGFNHGYYDGVMITLYDVHSGDMFWGKRYPKSGEKEPRQKDESILIDSIHCATVDGQLRSNVRMKLAPLIPAEDFIKHGTDSFRKYPRMLEGLRIEVRKYKKTGNLEFTNNEFDLKLQEHAEKLDRYTQNIDDRNSIDSLKRTVVHRNVYRRHSITHKLRLTGGIAVPNEEIEKYLVPPAQYDQRFKYGNTQSFYYLWRGEKFFDTMAIAQTPITSIRQPWDLLSPKERETVYTELSRHDFQQIWSHHCKNLGPKPKKAAVRALKDELLKNLPEYWRSSGKLYSREKPTAFKKLQERRRYLDKGEVPEDLELVGKSEEAAIDLENEPERLEKPLKNIQAPSHANPRAGFSNDLGQAMPKPVVLPMNVPETSPQVQPDQNIERPNLATTKSAQVQQTAEFAGTSIQSPSIITETFNPANNMLDTPYILNTAAQVASNVLQSFCSKSSEEVARCVTEKPDTISRVAKRPSEFMDLSRPKRLSQSMRSSIESTSIIESGHISGKFFVEMKPISSSIPGLAKVKYDPYISEAQSLDDLMDIDVPQNIMLPNSSAFKSPLTNSIDFVSTAKKPSSKVAAISTVKVELEAPQVATKITAIEPVQMTEMLPNILLLKPEPLSTDVTIPITPPKISLSEAFPASITSNSKVKHEESKTISKPAVETRLEPAENSPLNSEIPLKPENSPSQTINTKSICTKVAEAPSIPVIDLETWVPSLAFTTTYLSTTSSAPIFKSEVELDKKSSLNLNFGLEGLDAELKTLEEEARRKEIELEDAMRVAEARKEINRVRRRIEQLRLGVLEIGGS